VDTSKEDSPKYQEESYPETVVPQHIQEELERIRSEAKPSEVLSTNHSGQCVGGPMDGMEAVSRYPKGFLLVDIPNQMVWIYDYLTELGGEEGAFHCRPRQNFDSVRGQKTADEPYYDARAYDAETMKGPRGYDGESHSR
jgi:hypothetical protein